MKKIYIVPLVVLVFGLVSGFFGGIYYQKKQFSSFSQQTQSRFRERTGAQNAGVERGEIINKDINSITIKLRDGGSRIILFSEKTDIGKVTSGSKDDLKSGEQVSAFGKQNSDGSFTAQMIQLGMSQMYGR